MQTELAGINFVLLDKFPSNFVLLDILFLPKKKLNRSRCTIRQFLRQTMVNFTMLNSVAGLADRASDIFLK